MRLASDTLAAASTLRSIRPSVMLSSSRMSRSSSTTRTVRLLLPIFRSGPRIALLLRVARQTPSGKERSRLRQRQPHRRGQCDAEATAATGDRNVFQRSLIGLAHLSRQIQAQSGAVLMRGEEWFEDLRRDLG